MIEAPVPIVRGRRTLYPITNKIVVQRDTTLDKYDGDILECYNIFPWGWTDMPPIASSMSISMALAFINFEGASARYRQDSFGAVFQRLNVEGENSVHRPDLSFNEWRAYDLANGGGLGAVVSASTPYRFGWHSAEGFTPNMNQPQTFVGTSSNIIELSSSDSLSGAQSVNEFGWMALIFTPDFFHIRPPSARSKDMVMWCYNLEYAYSHFGNTGAWGTFPPFDFEWSMSPETMPNVPINNNVFLPGQQGRRFISNDFKYAPWERYSHLL